MLWTRDVNANELRLHDICSADQELSITHKAEKASRPLVGSSRNTSGGECTTPGKGSQSDHKLPAYAGWLAWWLGPSVDMSRM